MKRVGDTFGNLFVGAIIGAIGGAILGAVLGLVQSQDIWSSTLRFALPGGIAAAIGGAVATAIGGERSGVYGMFGALLGASFGALGGEGLGANEWLSAQLSFLEDPNLSTFVLNYVEAVGGPGPFVGMVFGTLVFLVIDIFRGDDVVATAMVAAIGLGILGAIVATIGGANAGTGAALGALIGAILGAFSSGGSDSGDRNAEVDEANFSEKGKHMPAPEDMQAG